MTSDAPVKKFWEALDFGRVSNRVCFTTDPTNLPLASPGSNWSEDTRFDEKIAIDDEPRIARVIEAARREGFALIFKVV